MKNEEAIKWLKDIHHRFNPTGEKLENEGGDVHLQALDMAIEALQTVDNCDQCEWCCPSDGIPTIHVVRCKDCKHYLNEHICSYFSRHGTIETSSYAYCSYGERRKP